MTMETSWYVVKVLPGKERSLTEQFNKEISLGKIKNIARFVCPTEKEFVAVKKKKVLREKVLYSGYLYFEALTKLSDDELKGIALIPNIMGMMGDKTPVQLRESDIRRILKDDTLEDHIDSKKLKYILGEQVLENMAKVWFDHRDKVFKQRISKFSALSNRPKTPSPPERAHDFARQPSL